MDFDLSREDVAFREEFRAWLTEHTPPNVDVAATFEEAEALREWQRTLHAGRWVGFHWPEEYGGRGPSLLQVAIYNEELARARAPQILGRAGVNLVGPTLIAHGTEVQRSRWLRKILSAEEIWCQLFSEPGAGSDLAGLSTRAERDGDVFRVIGQQVWRANARTLTRLARGEQIGPESSIVKLFWTEMSQKLYENAGAIFGEDALVMAGDPRALDRGRWSRGMLWSRAASIAGGTSEIQRNIIGERLLGLPREPK